MALKVKAREKLLKFSKDSEGVWKWVMQRAGTRLARSSRRGCLKVTPSPFRVWAPAVSDCQRKAWTTSTR